MCSFLLSVTLCVFAITSIWMTWRNHPVTVTFDDKTTDISQIPFPAVTICSTQKVKEKVDETEGYIGFEKLFPRELVLGIDLYIIIWFLKTDFTLLKVWIAWMQSHKHV